MDKKELPFKVGQQAEARSFESGFRGAWFRCKIRQIGKRKKGIVQALEYFDFPDEKIRWTQLYQKPPGRRHVKQRLMIRPAFPPVYRESELPDVNMISEVVVVVNDVWHKGDLVDWWTDGCYWSASISEILGDGKAQIVLPPPPLGEGYSYEVLCKDLRPSLEWSPDDGWTVPTSEDKKNCCPCARVIKPTNLEVSRNLLVNGVDEVKKDAEAGAGASLEYNASFSSRASASAMPPGNKSEQVDQPLMPAACQEEMHTLGTNVDSDAVEADTIEAPILDMEELVNRIKWMKSMLQLSTPLSTNGRPSWKFVEPLASSFPK